MSNKKSNTCNCKHLCIECEHIYEQEKEKPRCYTSAKKQINCVDGKEYTEYKLCEQLNKNGQCKKWKLDKEKADKKQFLALLEKYIHKHYSSSYADIGTYLAIQLSFYIKCANHVDLDFFVAYDQDDDYGDVVYKFDPSSSDYRKKNKRYEKHLEK